ncbi:OmpP1/FadL family transporter [Shewanella atlantica]|uniref:Aromatic hydrocarbon degradation protein n=1 Tax=Shewanella atlantica TaxID=271099 RepID=A0A431WG80_9GAMM|nr:outer membrane protein transport protein [Shewanella atlantica]RTR34267.1 aromatic hydrocarbon degradation protein [Shewanella atlantica]
MKYFNKTILAVAVTLASSQAMAAGFQLNSQSATGLGRAFAGDAVIADNASVLSRNPAAMALFDEKSLSVGVAYADLDVNVSDVSIPLGNYGNADDVAENKLIPNFYYIQPINDKWAFGVAGFSNFGTGTDLTGLANSNPKAADGSIVPAPAPVDLLGNTEIITMNFNASLSYRFNDHFSVGAGVDIIYGEGNLSREGNLPFGENGSMVPVSLVDVEADGVAFGGIIGAVYEFNADHRLGMSYRFSPEFKATGDVNMTQPGVGAIAFDEINIPMPDIFQVAGFHQLTEKFALHYTAQLTTWGDFHEITVTDGQLANGTPVGDAVLKQYAWDDSWLFSVGGTYTINEKWKVRAGYMHDQGVVGDVSSLSIPDSDRNWYTAGVSYGLSTQSTIDMGVAFVRGEDVHVTEHSSVIEAIPGLSGDVTAYTRSDAVYYSVQYSYQF